MKLKAGVLCLLLLFSAPKSVSQDSVIVTDGYRQTTGWTTRKILAASFVGTIMLTTMYDSYNTWWKDSEKPFSFLGHSVENWMSGPHQGIDKPGHFFGAYVMTKTIRNILLWGGNDRATAFWWSAAFGLWNGLQIEIGDGFSPYGFDYQDLVVDFAGVGFEMLRAEVPMLQNFDFKFSYWSKTGFRSPANFVNDYDAMGIWLTVNLHNLLPSSMRGYWPKFLQLAVGYGVAEKETRRKFAIGLDFNLEAFDFGNEDLLLTQRVLNIVHLPAPAIRIVEDAHPSYRLFFTE
jgi:Predicted periplasmic lipoprotein (DUF2279)